MTKSPISPKTKKRVQFSNDRTRLNREALNARSNVKSDEQILKVG